MIETLLPKDPATLDRIILALLVPAIGGFAAFFHKVAEVLIQRRKQGVVEADSFSARMNALADQLQEELARTKATVDSYAVDLVMLRSVRWSLEDGLVQTHIAALAARTLVHELQRSAGEPLTVFPPLPRSGGAGHEPP